MEADPSILLEWLETKFGELRDLQLTALEQLCNEVLFSDNIDVFYERYPPQTFFPPLCKIFMDEEAPPDVLEANARAVTYFLDMHIEWHKYLLRPPEVLKALSNHLHTIIMTCPKSNEFGQQLIKYIDPITTFVPLSLLHSHFKLLKLLCSSNSNQLYRAGLLTSTLSFIKSNSHLLHTDVQQAGMDVVRKLLAKASPTTDPDADRWVDDLSFLLLHHNQDSLLADQALTALASLTGRFDSTETTGTSKSLHALTQPRIISCLLGRLRRSAGGGLDLPPNQQRDTPTSGQLPDEVSIGSNLHLSSSDNHNQPSASNNNTASINAPVVNAVANILITLCYHSPQLTSDLLTGNWQFASTLGSVLQRCDDETVTLTVLCLVEKLLVLLYKKEPSAKADRYPSGSIEAEEASSRQNVVDSVEQLNPSAHADEISPRDDEGVCVDKDEYHRQIIEAIKRQDRQSLQRAIDADRLDVNYTDQLGQSLLNWTASFGSPAMVSLLLSAGANIDGGARSALDYATSYGRVEVCRLLLEAGANPEGSSQHGGLTVTDSVRQQLAKTSSSPTLQAKRVQLRQILALLEQHVKDNDGGNSATNASTIANPATRSTRFFIPSHADDDESDQPSSSRAEAQRLFLLNLFPIFAKSFSDSKSLSVKRQSALLTIQMVLFMTPDQLEELSSSDINGAPFAFSLTRRIHAILSQETIEFIFNGLELSKHLLSKAPDLYKALYHRFGVAALMVNLVDLLGRLVPDSLLSSLLAKLEQEQSVSGDAATSTVVEDASTLGVGAMTGSDSKIDSNSRFERHRVYSWHYWKLFWIGKSLVVFNKYALVNFQLDHLTDNNNGLQAIALYRSSSGRRVTWLLAPGQKPVQKSELTHSLSQMHQQLLQISRKSNELPLDLVQQSSPDTTNDQPPSSQTFDQITAKYFRKKLRHHFASRNWCRLSNRMGLRNFSVGLQCSSLSFPLLRTNPSVVTVGYQPRLLSTLVKPTRSSRLMRTRSSLGCSCLSSSLPGQELSTTSRQQSPITIGKLSLSLMSADACYLCISSLLTDRSSELFLFTKSPRNGFARARIDHVPVNSASVSDSSPESRRRSLSEIRLDSRLADATSFDLDGANCLDDLQVQDCHDNNWRDQHCRLVNSPEKWFADTYSALFSRDLVHVDYQSGQLIHELSRLDLKKSSKRKTRLDAKACLNTHYKESLRLTVELLSLLGQIDDPMTDSLRSLVRLSSSLASLPCINEIAHVLSRLTTAFAELSSLMTFSGQDVGITAYELLVSGLFQSLLRCLAISSIDEWNCQEIISKSPNLDLKVTQLWYLLERRRCFLASLSPHSLTSPVFKNLVRLLVEAIELTEQLPLRAFALASLNAGGGGGLKNNTKSTIHVTSHFDDDIESDAGSNSSSMAGHMDADQSRSSSSTPATNQRQCRIDQLFALAYGRRHSRPKSICLPLGLIRSLARQSDVDTLDFVKSSKRLDHKFYSCLDQHAMSILSNFARSIPTGMCDPISSSSTNLHFNALDQLETRLAFHITPLDKKAPFFRFSSTLDVHASLLVTVEQMQRFIRHTYSKEWYDEPRTSVALWSQLTTDPSPLPLTLSPPSSAVNQDAASSYGLIDWLATNGATNPLDQWVNPALVGLVTIASSTSSTLIGQRNSILGPRSGSLVGGYPIKFSGYGAVVKPYRPHSGDDSNAKEVSQTAAWFALDTGLQFRPTAYSLAYLRRSGASSRTLAPRNWRLEASNDAVAWTLLRQHRKDDTIQSSSGSRALWPIEDDDVASSWRFFRLLANGPNANGSRELAVGGFDLFGSIVGTHDTLIESYRMAQLILQLDDTNSSAPASKKPSVSVQRPTSNEPPIRRTVSIGSRSNEELKTTDPLIEEEVATIITTSTNEDSQLAADVLSGHTFHAPSGEDVEMSELGMEQLFSASTNPNNSQKTDNDDEKHPQSNCDNRSSNDDDEEEDELELPYAALANTPTTPQSITADSTVVSSSVEQETDESMAPTVADFTGMSGDGDRDQTTTTTTTDVAIGTSAHDGELFALDARDTSDSDHHQQRQDSAGSRSLGSRHRLVSSSTTTRSITDSNQPPLTSSDWLANILELASSGSDHLTNESGGLADYSVEDIANALEFADQLETIIRLNRGGRSANNNNDARRRGGEEEEASSSDERRLLNLVQLLDQAGDGDDNESCQDEEADQDSDEITTFENLDAFNASPAGRKIGGLSLHREPTDSLLVCRGGQPNESIIVRKTTTQRKQSQKYRSRRSQQQRPVESSNRRPPIGKRVGNAKPPAVRQPLSLGEALGLLRLPPGLIPAFVPSPGYTNAPATTQFSLCHPPTASRNHRMPTLQRALVDLSTESYPISSPYQGYGGAVGSMAVYDPQRWLWCNCMNGSSKAWLNRVNRKGNPPNIRNFGQILRLSRRSIDNVFQTDMTTRPVLDLDELVKSSLGGDVSQDKLDKSDNSKTQSAYRDLALRIGHRSIASWPPSRSKPTANDSHPLFLSDNDLHLTPNMNVAPTYSSSDQSSGFNLDLPSLTDRRPSDTSANPTIAYPNQLLHLLNTLYLLSGVGDQPTNVVSAFGHRRPRQRLPSSCSSYSPRLLGGDSTGHQVSPLDFVSRQLTVKLVRQLKDPLALCTSTLPDWVNRLARRIPALFSFDARLELLRAAAFGPARSAIWSQSQPVPKSTAGYDSPSVLESLPSIRSIGNITHVSGSTAGTSNFLPTNLLSQPLLTLPTTTDVLANSNPPPPTSLQQLEAGDDQPINDLLTCLFNIGGTTSTTNTANDSTTTTVVNFGSSSTRTISNATGTSTTITTNGNGTGNSSPRSQFARLAKEYVRLPRLPLELLSTTAGKDRSSSTLDEQASSSSFWDWAASVMHEHAERKAELEVQFIGEDGTGIGPTLEFFSILAAEIRRRDGLMWVVDDQLLPAAANAPTITTTSYNEPSSRSEHRRAESDDEDEDELSRLAMPTVASQLSLTGSTTTGDLTDHVSLDTSIELEASLYVDASCGLFPAPWPAKLIPDSVLERFYILGITVGKCLQDSRRIDLPLSLPLLKLLCAYGSLPITPEDSRETGSTILRPPVTTITSASQLDLSTLRCRRLLIDDQRSTPDWTSHLLDLDDFCLLYPQRAKFMHQLTAYCQRRRRLPTDSANAYQLELDIFGCSLGDMCLGMEFIPSSKTHGFSSVPLQDRYAWEDEEQYLLSESKDASNQVAHLIEEVNSDNAERYLLRTLDFCLDKGIRRQLNAFKVGFERVLPLTWLALFTPHELGQLIAGDSVARWTRDELTAYLVPGHGYTRQSKVYTMLINVLCNFSLAERRAFLQFTTGCSSLPPGGLKNLYPRLRINHKGVGAGAFPSVNTCVHYLKLPEYKSEAELRTALLAATREIGFYLN